MGWNDRLPTDPYLPPEEYYQSGAEEHHAWLEYVEMRLHDESRGISSQNLDPAMLAGQQFTQEAPKRQKFLSRIWAAIFGQSKENTKEKNSKTEDADLRDAKQEIPF